jgi:hypothetical protein
MHITDLVGSFYVEGANQNAEGSTYKGTLTLSLIGQNRLQAIWQIGNDQTQFGEGFFKNNLLVINFYYQGVEDTYFYGTVAYTCLSADRLEGIWTEEAADPNFVGEEKAIRLKTSMAN